jgi:hypothetical protein
MSESKYRSVRTVAVIRPPEQEQVARQQVSVTVSPPPQENETEQGKQAYTINCGGMSFQFPAVYGHQGVDLDSLCQREVEDLLQASFKGESSALIAYGQTGAGKSYLCGTECKSPEPWQNSVGAYVSRRIFEIKKEKEKSEKIKDFTVEASMIEIYREGSSKETTLDLLGGYTRVPLHGYSEGSYYEVYSGEELLEKLITGSGLRNTDATNGNARSSRSHAILTIRIHYTKMDTAKRAQRVSGKFLLVDLAGAEAASAAAANSTQQKQGSGINVGLSALQLVIREVATIGKTLHYRDSKLTHLLKPALGGEDGIQGCNATFLGCVSPSLADEKRTQNTLNYMQQAANIKNSIKADVKLVEAKKEAALKKENELLKSQLQQMAAELQAVATLAAAEEGEIGGIDTHHAVRAEDVVVLTVAEHQELLAKSDKAAALDIILQKDQERFSLLQNELDQANQRIAELEHALYQAQSQSQSEKQQLTIQLPPLPAIAPPASTTTTAALSPAMAALSVNPILIAASRSVDDPGPLSSRARPSSARGGGVDGNGDDKTNEATAAVDTMPFANAKLDIDEICLTPEMSHLAPEQLEVLRKLVKVRLQKGDTPSTTTSAATGGSTLQAALRRRTAEVTALRFAVHSYNACLGNLMTELDNVKECERETARLLKQAAQEKVQYVELVAQHQQALDIAQYDVVTLDAEVKELKQRRKSSISASPTSAGGGGGGNSGSGLFNRLIGKSPMASPPASSPMASDIAKKSPVPSPPYSSPRKPNSAVKERETSGGGGSVSPFPIADIDVDDFDSDYEEAGEEEIVDLTADSPLPPQQPTTVTAAAAAEQVNAIQKKMDGGINVGAIGASRSVTDEFVEKNQHWRPFQKNKPTTRSSGKKV